MKDLWNQQNWKDPLPPVKIPEDFPSEELKNKIKELYKKLEKNRTISKRKISSHESLSSR